MKQFGKAFRGVWYVLSFQLTPVPSALPSVGFVLCPLALQQPAVTGSVTSAQVHGAADRATGRSHFPSQPQNLALISMGAILLLGLAQVPLSLDLALSQDLSVPTVKTALAFKKKKKKS